MKFFHISDLHIGKQLNCYSLKKNQEEILNQIIEKIKEYRPDALLIAGDIYDRSVPSAEAYTMFDQFLNQISIIEPKVPVLIISGNHDSCERLKFASSFFEKQKIYISTFPPQTKEEYLKQIVLEDEYGAVHFYLLPFIKPLYVRHLFEEGKITSYHSAIKELIEREKIDYNQRNVLLSHQFYVSGNILPEVCESEQIYLSVGGIDSVDVSAVEDFDYVALGHLHGPQKVLKDTIRYCGTPLKYSVSEEKHKKSITMVTLYEKGKEVKIDTIPLIASQDVRTQRGTMEEILASATKENCHDFVSITLTNEEDLFMPKDQLETRYDSILEVKIDNKRTREKLMQMRTEATRLDPFAAFLEFYEEMNNVPMNKEEEQILSDVLLKLKEES